MGRSARQQADRLISQAKREAEADKAEATLAAKQEILELREGWERELAEIRERILQLRSDFVEAMQKRVPEKDFQYINLQRGMFSYSGLRADQVARLKSKYSIYILKSGRINVAGINAGNLDRLCDAIASVV